MIENLMKNLKIQANKCCLSQSRRVFNIVHQKESAHLFEIKFK